MRQSQARVLLSRLVENGKLVKVGRGLYALPESNFNEQQSLLEAVRLVPKGVVCLLSALRSHDLTTQNPFEIWMAIEGTSWLPTIEYLPLRVFCFFGQAFAEGIETHDIESSLLKLYFPTKTVADCFKYRNKIGLDVAIEALRDCWRKASMATIDELWHFAKVCRLANVRRHTWNRWYDNRKEKSGSLRGEVILFSSLSGSGWWWLTHGSDKRRAAAA